MQNSKMNEKKHKAKIIQWNGFIKNVSNNVK